MLCLLPTVKRQKEAVCGTAGPGPPLQGPSFLLTTQTDFPSALISLAVHRIPTVPGMYLIVPTIWVAAPFFHIPVNKFQRTLWSLVNLFSQPPQKQASSVVQIKESITDTRGIQPTGLPHTESRPCSNLASAFDLLCGLCFLLQ